MMVLDRYVTPMRIRVTDRKSMIREFGISDTGVVMDKKTVSAKPVLLPQLEFSTNDTWQLVFGLGNENNFPVLLKTSYGEGTLYVLTIPDDFGDSYDYPREVLNCIRGVLSPEETPILDASGNIELFTYDNNTFVIKSFLPYEEEVSVKVPNPEVRLMDLASREEIAGRQDGSFTVFKLGLSPMSFRVCRIR